MTSAYIETEGTQKKLIFWKIFCTGFRVELEMLITNLVFEINTDDKEAFRNKYEAPIDKKKTLIRGPETVKWVPNT